MSSIVPSRNTPPQAVVFDLGKVLLDFNYGRASQALAAQSDLDADSIQEIIDQTPLLHAYESGRISTAAFFEQFRELASYHGTCTEFATAFADIFAPIQSMLDLHDTLVVRGVPCHVFSNTNALAVQHIRQTYPFFEHFQQYLLSYQVGAMKPEIAMYEAVEAKTQCPVESLLYVDDRFENIEAAKSRGWRVIHHVEPETTIAAFRRWMV